MAPSEAVASTGGSVGNVFGWGSNYSGQASVPAGLTGITAIAAGRLHSLALKSDGSVVGWGYNDYGQASVPAGLTGVTAIAAGSDHSLALNGDGTVSGWGYNDYGQASVPAGLTGAIAIAAGGRHSLALKSDGTVVGWGSNDSGQASVPAGLTGITAIASGVAHSLALKSDGTVVGWGSNDSGQASVPAGLTGITAITAGFWHSLALKSDGTVVGWGYNGNGETDVPAGLTGVIAIASGAAHSLAVKSDGTVVGWGHGGDGQSTVPAGLTGVTAIAAGGFHNLALIVDSASPDTVLDTHPAAVTNVTTASFGFHATEVGVTFQCQLDAGAWERCTSPTSYPGLAEGMHSFAVRATDYANNTDPTAVSWAFTVDTTPGPPTSVSARAAVNAAKVSWQPPTSEPPASEGGVPVTGYTATASPGGQTCSTGGAGRACLVTGLSNGGSYRFTVTATNATGTSEPSSTSNTVTPAVDTTAPVLVSSSVTPTRISSFGGAVTVELRITDDLSGVRTPSGEMDANPAVIFNRTDNTGSGVGFTRAVSRISGDEYDGTYRAVVDIPYGTSPGSWDLTVYPIDDNYANSTSFTDRPGIMVGTPAAPANVTASAASNRDVTITWDAPADDGGNVVSGYRVDGSGGKLFTTTGTTVTTSVYADWPATTPVAFTVTAVNAAGFSPSSAASAPLTIPAAAPAAPTGVTGTRGDQSAQVTWNAAANHGSPVTGYTITRSPGGITKTVPGDVTHAAITGLTNGTAYTFTVKAANALGDSPVSAASQTITPAGAPLRMLAPKVAVRGSKVTVRWHAANSNGSPVTQYKVDISKGKDKSLAASARKTAFDRLKPGRYRVRVTARNAIGTAEYSTWVKFRI